jgi:hypothetical protein
MEKCMASFLNDGSGLIGFVPRSTSVPDRITGVLPVIGPGAIPVIDHFRHEEALCRLARKQDSQARSRLVRYLRSRHIIPHRVTRQSASPTMALLILLTP